MHFFTALEVCRIAKVSERNLHYWDITHVISPTKPAQGPGVYRRYTREDVICVSVVKHMRDAGISLQKVRQHTQDIQLIVRQALKDGATPLVLIRNGNPIIVIRDPSRPQQSKMLVDALRGRQLVLALDLAPIAEQVSASLTNPVHGKLRESADLRPG